MAGYGCCGSTAKIGQKAPRVQNGAKWCERVGKDSNHETGERQSFGPPEKPGNRKESEGIRHWRTNAQSLIREDS